jgi:formylglycine-generating enzyme required for sulfatase activity
MRDLEIPLSTNANVAVVDLFGGRHAREVLAAFGRAYGALPERPDDLTDEQESFLDQAISGLAQDGRVVPVRLALFAEMVKRKPWTPETFKQAGGAEGVGVTFLEETFSARSAPPSHRIHQKAAQAVLKALLPETGSNIKGNMRSYDELLVVSGYGPRPDEFEELLRILDGELRLITPIEPEGSESDGQARTRVGEKYFLLTHDYLVPSIREWLTRKQRETRRGRAELKLGERSAAWNAKPENRQLPSVSEWASIRLLTEKKDWTEPERRMMRRAGRVHVMRAVGLAVLLGLGTWAGNEVYGYLRAEALVESLKTASTLDVPPIIDQLAAYRRWAARPLDRLLASTEHQSGPHLRASLASVALWPGDGKQTQYLEERLLASSLVELPVILGILRQHEPGTDERLRQLLDDQKEVPERRFRAACALVNSKDVRVEKQWDVVAPFLTDRFLAAVIKNPSDYSPLIETLRPIRHRLLTPLASIFRNARRSESERGFATTVLADYASDVPDLLADLLMDADPKSYTVLFSVVARQAAKTLPLFQAEIQKIANPPESETNIEQIKDRLAERQARAAVALVRMGHPEEVWHLMRHNADPRLRSFIVNWLNPLGADPMSVVAGLDGIYRMARPTAAPGEQVMNAVLFQPETSIRRALILALGTYWTERLSPAEREPLINKLLDLYRNDADAGVHGATEWTLRQWKQQEKLEAVDSELMTLKDRGDRRWYVNSQGQTFAVIEGPVEFSLGSPPTEPERDPEETPHRVRLPRRFAIASKEVSVEQYQRFVRTHPNFGSAPNYLDKYSPDPSGPMIAVSWYGAAAFCNWLSKEEGIPANQWCFLPNERGEYADGMPIPGNALQRTGYRLPSDAEWEYSCRAGSMTSRYYGLSSELLLNYAWYQANSQEHASSGGRLLPNDLGLFDMLGNVSEWCLKPARSGLGMGDGEALIEQDPNQEIKVGGDDPRTLRSGSFSDNPSSLRSASRVRSPPSLKTITCGFRIVRTYQ